MSIKLRALVGVLLVALLAVPLARGRFQAANTAEKMSKTAEAFLASLNADQKKKATGDFDAAARTDWHFIPKPERKGLQIRDMDDAQRKKAHALLQSSLSEVGYGKTNQIMAMENFLKELEKGKTSTPLRDAERYYFIVFGEPSDEGRWGLSIEGHHMSLNFVVDRGEVAAFEPLALCANPATVMNDVLPSVKKGLRILAAEEQTAYALFESLSAEQKKKAVIDAKAPAEIRAAGEKHPPQTAAEGVPGKDLTKDQQGLLRKLVGAYLANVPADVADSRLKAIEGADWESVHFAWAGSGKPGEGQYYRVQGKTFLIEFVNTQPDAAGNPANHIHCVWRNMQGDFGLPAKSEK